MYVYDVFTIKFSTFTCYMIKVSCYDTTIISLLINYCVTSDLCNMTYMILSPSMKDSQTFATLTRFLLKLNNIYQTK
jgi:hypothetical protein